VRHEELRNSEAFELVDAPALASQTEARPQPEHAVSDMPKAAGIFMIASYAALMLAFVVTIHGARAEFAIVIGAFYLAMFFGVPVAMLGIENDPARRPNRTQFLDRGIETATGWIGGSGALVQMLIVPVLLALAVLAMGITFLVV
jgi:hypothetical protein